MCAQLEKEVLAYEVKQYHKYLEQTIDVDLKILGQYEGVPTLAVARLQQWELLFIAYSYKLKFKSGVDKKYADLLSRLPKPMQAIDPNKEIHNGGYCDQLPVTPTKIARKTQRNPVLRKAYTRSG